MQLFHFCSFSGHLALSNKHGSNVRPISKQNVLHIPTFESKSLKTRLLSFFLQILCYVLMQYSYRIKTIKYEKLLKVVHNVLYQVLPPFPFFKPALKTIIFEKKIWMKKKSIRIQTKNIMDYPIIPLIIPKKKTV